MALLTFEFESEYLQGNNTVHIILPDKPRGADIPSFYNRDKKYKVLWLLHGTFGSSSDYIRKSNIELYACERDLIVVLPSVDNSGYQAWNNYCLGNDAHKYIIDELMPIVYNWFPASDKKEDNYIAGLSMGGGGAMKFALKYPEKFAGCGVLSAAPWEIEDKIPEWREFYKVDRETIDPADIPGGLSLRLYNQMHRFNTFEEYLTSDGVDNFGELKKQLHNPLLPQFFFGCGTEDWGIERFRKLENWAKEVGFDAKFVTGPGRHEWRVWERDIQKMLDYFGIQNKDAGNAF